MAIRKSHNIEYKRYLGERSLAIFSEFWTFFLTVVMQSGTVLYSRIKCAVTPQKYAGEPTEMALHAARAAGGRVLYWASPACASGHTCRGAQACCMGCGSCGGASYAPHLSGFLNPFWRQRHKNGHFTLGQAVED